MAYRDVHLVLIRFSIRGDCLLDTIINYYRNCLRQSARLLSTGANTFIEIFLLFIMSLNNTTSCQYLSMEEAQALFYSITESVMITVVLPVISGIGVLLNSSFLFTLYRVEDMRTTTNIYRANLAVADEMFLVIQLANYLRYALSHHL